MRSRGWALAAVLGAALLLVASARPWLEVTTDDAVLGQAALSVSGGEMSRAVPAAALLAGAALVAGLVGSRVVRVIAAACLLLAAVVAAVPVLGALTDPAGAAQPALRERTAITGVAPDAGPVAGASATWAVWVAVLAVLLFTLAAVLRVLPGPARSRTPTAPSSDEPGREVGAATDWERLSAGDDPTADPTDDADPPRR